MTTRPSAAHRAAEHYRTRQYEIALGVRVTYRGGRGMWFKVRADVSSVVGPCKFGARGEQRADGGTRLAALHQIDR